MRLRIIPQAWIAGHRVDFLIGERLVLQIDGGHHVGKQREDDIRHDAELRLSGYTVIRVGYRLIIDDWPAVQDLVMRAVAQGLHLAS
jgi:very-short-patch-repair endonuclease